MEAPKLRDLNFSAGSVNSNSSRTVTNSSDVLTTQQAARILGLVHHLGAEDGDQR